MRPALPALAAAGLIGLAGCANEIDAPLSPTFGASVASMNNQIIDPTPAQGIPETSGAKGSAAIARYEEDRVKDPPGAYREVRTGGPGAAGAGSGDSGSSGSSGGGSKP